MCVCVCDSGTSDLYMDCTHLGPSPLAGIQNRKIHKTDTPFRNMYVSVLR